MPVNTYFGLFGVEGQNGMDGCGARLTSMIIVIVAQNK
jgi:hypothetical protein